MTEEQYQRYAAILNDVERLRRLSRTEKERIIRGILDTTFIDLTCDWAFRHVFGHNLELLKMLLNDILPEKITEVIYDPNAIDRTTVRDKNVIMDVFCHTEDGRRIVVEMQKKEENDFGQRMLYYGAARLREQLEVGDDYEKLCPVYVICFMEFTLPHYGVAVPQGKIMFSYKMMEEQTQEPYGDNWLNIILCELPRLRDDYMNQFTPQEQWFALFRYLPNFASKPDWLDDRFEPLLQEARTRGLKSEEETQYLQAMLSKEEIDKSVQKIAKAYLRRGREEAQEEERIKHHEDLLRIAKSLLASGMSSEEVARHTGLPLEEVQSL